MKLFGFSYMKYDFASRCFLRNKGKPPKKQNKKMKSFFSTSPKCTQSCFFDCAKQT